MKKLLLATILAIVAAAVPAKAQIYDVACPAGSSVLANSQTLNPTNGHLKAYLCVDNAGNVTSPVLGGGLGLTGASGHEIVSTNCGNPFQLNCKQVADDGYVDQAAVWAINSNTVTTSNAVPPFASTGSVYPATCVTFGPTCDVGKTVLRLYNCATISPPQCNSAGPQATITAITGPHAATLSSNSTHASTDGSGLSNFAWCTIDTAPISAAVDAALTASQPTDVLLPAGNMCIDNSVLSPVRVTRSIYPIGYQGAKGLPGTAFILLPRFTCADTAGCVIHLNYTPGQITVLGWGDTADNIQVTALGLDVPDAGFFTGTSHTLIRAGTGDRLTNVNATGAFWNGPSANTDYGIECLGAYCDNVQSFVAGNRCFHGQGAPTGFAPGLIQNGYFGGCKFTSCTIDGASGQPALTINEMNCGDAIQSDGTALSAALNIPAGTVASITDNGSSYYGPIFVNGGNVKFNDTFLDPLSGATTASLLVGNAAATVTVTRIHYQIASGFPWLALSAGTVYDGCENTGVFSGSNAATITGGTLVNCPSEPSVSGRCLLASAASPLACGNSSNGKFAVPVSTPTYIVNSKAIPSGGVIQVTATTDNTGIPGAPTCGAEVFGDGVVTASTPGTSFQIAQVSAAVIKCYSWRLN